MTDKLVIAIDGANWVHRAFHTPGTQPNKSAVIFCDMLVKVARTFGPSHLFVAFDDDPPTWRHQLMPSYKSARPPKSEELLKGLSEAQIAAEEFGCQVLFCPKFEGDDILATVALRASNAGLPTMIASSDKDMLQLCSDKVRCLNAKYETLGPDEVEDRWGVPPGRFVEMLALMGDSTDSIPGVDGIGPVNAATLVNTYGSALAAVDHAAEVGGKRGAALASSRAMVELNLKLVALMDHVDLGCSLRSTTLNYQALADFRADLLKPASASISVPCYGVCKGDPKYRQNGMACSLCGGSGKATTYNQQALAAQEWDAVRAAKG